jgi:hypothetical protein
MYFAPAENYWDMFSVRQVVVPPSFRNRFCSGLMHSKRFDVLYRLKQTTDSAHTKYVKIFRWVIRIMVAALVYTTDLKPQLAAFSWISYKWSKAMAVSHMSLEALSVFCRRKLWDSCAFHHKHRRLSRLQIRRNRCRVVHDCSQFCNRICWSSPEFRTTKVSY